MTDLKLALGGSEGRMGTAIRNLVPEAGFVPVGYIDPRKEDGYKSVEEYLSEVEKIPVAKAEIYIDFTTPATVVDNIRAVSEAGIDSVIGTTGWYDRMQEIEDIAEEHERIILYPLGNFAIGANAYIWALRKLSEILGPYGFDAAEAEFHHTGKKDSPSGTALKAAEGLIELPGKEKLTHVREGKDAQRAANEIDVMGLRVGSVTGRHLTLFSPIAGDYERLEIIHDAYNREVFARPALFVAVPWVFSARQEGKEPGVYEFSRDVLKLPE